MLALQIMLVSRSDINLVIDVQLVVLQGSDRRQRCECKKGMQLIAEVAFRCKAQRA